MARRLVIPLALTLSMCRRSAAPPDAPTRPPEPDVVLPGDAPTPTGSCRLAGVTWLARPAASERFTASDGVVSVVDAGDGITPTIETVTAMWGADANPWVAWVDARDRTARLARAGRRDIASITLGTGNHSDLALALTGPARDVPLLAWVRDAMGGRAHSVHMGATLAEGCEQSEGRDEALQVTVAATPQGALLAWDDIAPGTSSGVVMIQRVVSGTPPTPHATRCMAPHQASPSDQDAGDPVLVATPDGNVALFWLDARDIDPGPYNDTVTDLWGRLLDGAGVPKGVPLRLTTTPGHRFGMSAAAGTEGSDLWLTYRVVPNSGTEARGDGGQVAVLHLTRSATGLGRTGDAAVVTLPDATPTGMPRVFAQRQGATVWWRERGPDGVVTWRRTLDPQGRALPASPPSPERALQGLLPSWSDPQGVAVAALVRTPGGGVGVARYRCGD